MPRHGRRQTYFETPGPHRDATPCFFPRTRPMPASERGSRRKRIWGLMRSYLGADATESGSRDERVWEQMRPRLPPDSLTGVGSRRIDLKALEADCNAERMASALESRALKIQRKSSLAVAPSQRKFALRQHNHLLRRQHCSSLCSQSEGHEHVANMTNALGHDFVVFSARAWPPQYSPPHFASKVSYSASPQGFVAPYYLAKTQGFLENLNTLPFRGAVASLPILIFLDFKRPTSKVKFRSSEVRPQSSEKPYVA